MEEKSIAELMEAARDFRKTIIKYVGGVAVAAIAGMVIFYWTAPATMAKTQQDVDETRSEVRELARAVQNAPNKADLYSFKEDLQYIKMNGNEQNKKLNDLQQQINELHKIINKQRYDENH